MMMFIIMLAVYIMFWVLAFVFIKSYISHLIKDIRDEVFNIAKLAKEYLKR